MYTHLLHDAVLSAVRDIIASTGGHLYFSTDLDYDKVSRHPTRDSPIKVTNSTVLDIISFDLNNAFSRTGARIITHQLIGVPIGGIMSGALARATCAWYENSFFSTNPGMESFYFGGRYTDDLRRAIATLPPIKGKALLDHLAENLYGSGLSVKHEEEDKVRCTYVGHRRTNDHTHTVSNANTTSILRHGERKIIRYDRKDSSKSRSTKLGPLVGAVIRTWDCSSSSGACAASLSMAPMEFSEIGYTTRDMSECMRKASVARPGLLQSTPPVRELMSITTNIRSALLEKRNLQKMPERR